MSGRRQSRHPRRGKPPALDLVEERVKVGGRAISLLRPRVADALLDEEAFEHEEFLPYWAELWPSALALAQEVTRLELDGLRVLELGCGLGLPSLVAARRGARVLATDGEPDAVVFAAHNLALNHLEGEVAQADWREAEVLLEGAPWDLVLASDVLYLRHNVEALLRLLPRLIGSSGEALVSDPSRAGGREFVASAKRIFSLETRHDPARKQVAVHRLRPRGAR
jgi:predicted nicotinamide N-methyase